MRRLGLGDGLRLLSRHGLGGGVIDWWLVRVGRLGAHRDVPVASGCGGAVVGGRVINSTIVSTVTCSHGASPVGSPLAALARTAARIVVHIASSVKGSNVNLVIANPVSGSRHRDTVRWRRNRS